VKITKAVGVDSLSVEIRLISERIEVVATSSMSLDRLVISAKVFCPVSTGALMDSIRVERRGPLETALIAGGGGHINPRTRRPVDYARHVHDGTSRVPPRPFLLQAVLSEQLRLAMEIMDLAGGLMQ